jgi:hypothetical protein
MNRSQSQGGGSAGVGFGPREASSIDRLLMPGILAGLVAAAAMGIFLMTAAATYQHRGFYTPMYHIASLLGDTTVESSVPASVNGEIFMLVPEPLITGVAIHLVVGGVFGGLFALVARTELAQRAILVAGVLYGLAVMVVMGLLVVPLADAALSGDPRVASFPSVAGWLTFAVAHVIYGLVLALWVVVRPQDVGAAPARSDGGD